MHEGSDEGQVIIFLLGQKGQLALPKAVEHDAGIGNEQVVAHQQEPALLRGVFQSFRMQPHPHQLNQGLDVEVHDPAVEGAVLLLGLVKVHHCADCPQKGNRQQKQPRVNAHEQQRQRPDRPVRTGKDYAGNQQRQAGNGFQKHIISPFFSLVGIILRFSRQNKAEY